MLLGIPRGFFYYDYIEFIRKLFHDTGVELIEGSENNEKTLQLGSSLSVDEVCLPIKLFVGQTEKLCDKSDKVLIPIVMKDYRGKWLCPKLLGLSEFVKNIKTQEKLLVTKPLYFNNERELKKALWSICRKLNVKKKKFNENFTDAYTQQKYISLGMKKFYVEAAWEFVPEPPKENEIILPNTRKVLVTGHNYNVYDKFANADIMSKLDEIGIDAVSERHVSNMEKEKAVAELNLIKKPFWEAMIRTLGTAICMKEQVDGIIYLSSFSCGLDAVIIEMMKKYVAGIPVMVLKLDEHRGEAGIETRIEAFADLIIKRRIS